MMRCVTVATMGCDALLLGAALVLLAACALLASGGAAAQSTEWNDTVIDTNMTNVAPTIILDGNLTIASGGDLTLRYCTLLVNVSPPRECTIRVDEGGTLNMWTSSVRSVGGPFRLIVKGSLIIDHTSDGGLYKDTPGPTGGIMVEGPGIVRMYNATIGTPVITVLALGDGARAELYQCTLRSDGPVVTVDHGATLMMIGTVMNPGRLDVPLVSIANGSRLTATGCWFYDPRVRPFNGTESTDIFVAVAVDGSTSSATLRGCVFEGGAGVSVDLGSLAITADASVARSSSIPFLKGRAANVSCDSVSVGTLNVTDGALWLYNASTFAGGAVSGDCTVYSYGIAPPNSTLAPTVTLHHHYRVDFLLLNGTRAPAPDNALYIETEDRRTVVIDTLSGPDGWVRGVWMPSWTRKGAAFSYEPPHRVEFGDVDYSITKVKVFGNTTVTLWNSDDQRDLDLVSDAVKVTDRSPREGDPFDVEVDGKRLVPYPYPSGTSGAGIVLFVDGRQFDSQRLAVTSQGGVTFRGLNLSEGLHTLRVIVDPLGEVPQLNRGGNDEYRVIVEVASRNYTGKEIDLYLRLTGVIDTNGNEDSPWEPGVLYVHFTVHARYATTFQRNVVVAIYVNGAPYGNTTVDLTRLEDQEYVATAVIPINLGRGTYAIELRVDPQDAFIERYENNNVDSTTIQVAPKPSKPIPFLFGNPWSCLALGAVGLVLVVALVSRRLGGRRPGTGPRAGPPGVPQAPPMEPTASGSSLAVPRELRIELSGVPCPKCGGGPVMGSSDGSASCRACKAVFYPE